MSIFISILFLLGGFALLVWGADHFVANASSLARRLGVPALIVGLTVVAFGTSAPELTVSVTAGLNQSNEIAISNVLGSNIFNLLVVAGLSAVIAPLYIEKSLLKRDWPASIFAAIALAVFVCLDGMLSRLDGALLLVGFVVILCLQIRSALSERNLLKEEVQEQEDSIPQAKGGAVKLLFNIVLSLAGIIVGGQLTVDGARDIALAAGMSETLVGLTIVAVGTSLPELVTSVMATRRGERDIAIGNVIGSNLFNILLILGTSSVLTPIPVQATAMFDSIVVVAISVLLFIPAVMGKFGRKIGVLSVLSYVAYTAWIIIR